MKELKCENTFCIYQYEDTCELGSINLDIQGNCTDCIYVNIDEKTLNELKEKAIK